MASDCKILQAICKLNKLMRKCRAASRASVSSTCIIGFKKSTLEMIKAGGKQTCGALSEDTASANERPTALLVLGCCSLKSRLELLQELRRLVLLQPGNSYAEQLAG